MKIQTTAFLISILLFMSCNPQAVKGELPPHTKVEQQKLKNQTEIIKNLKSPDLYYLNYEVFRYNQLSLIDQSYQEIDPVYLSALSNEFELFSLDKQQSLKIALRQYADIIQQNPTTTNAFLLQRVGITYYKLNNMDRANKYLSRALLAKQENPELFYYRALIAAYHTHDFKTAAWYLRRINLDQSLFPPQDILYFIAKMEEEQENYSTAERYYNHSINISPSRFYILYDLLPFYKKWGKIRSSETYINNTFNYLTSLSNTRYHVKAYKQKLELNRNLVKDTFYHTFRIPSPYNYFPNLYYFVKSPYYTKKRYAKGLTLPILEHKKNRTDILMYLTYENLEDNPYNSGIVIIGGGISITNFRYAHKRLYTPISKHFFYTNVIAFMSPTNQPFVHTNFARSTNHSQYITKGVSNSLFQTNLDFDYYLSAHKFDVDNDNNWDYVVFGIKDQDKIGMTIFYPSLKKVVNYTLPIKRNTAEVYIQDMDNDGKKEIYLLDDRVYMLQPDSTVK